MIVAMQRVRILGPRSQLDTVVGTLQDVGILHPCRVDLAPPVVPASPTARQLRHVRVVEAALADIEETMSRLGLASTDVAWPALAAVEPLPREVLLAHRARRATSHLVGEMRALEDEREHLARTVGMLEAFAGLEPVAALPGRRVLYLVIERTGGDGLERLRRSLAETLGESFALHERPLAGNGIAVALVVPAARAQQLDRLLPEAGVREVELPGHLEAASPEAAADAMRQRLAQVDAHLARLEERRRQLGEWLRPGLLRARAALHDWLLASETRSNVGLTEHLFVLEGWLPADERGVLTRALGQVDAAIVIEEVGRERWTTHDVPVAIRNPPLLRPFEVITRRLPLPRYGTMDPTPFVAVFFPMFFGLILGDVGYGAVLAALAALGWRRSEPGSALRSVSQIAAVCAIFSMLFGVFFGELFGDLGRRLFGMQAVSFSRENAIVPFLVLAVSIGFVHVVLGLVLGALSGRRTDPRQALGRGLTALMLVLTAVLLLAAVEVLPRAFFTPAVIALLLSFPVLILLEGFVGAIELLSRVGNILSYARIMALGTASVMLAVVANEMVGTLGGVGVGVLFATLFHLVNFGLGVFSPTIHALRLHFVEFFGTFYSPGGQLYRPLRHWRPADAPTPHSA